LKIRKILNSKNRLLKAFNLRKFLSLFFFVMLLAPALRYPINVKADQIKNQESGVSRVFYFAPPIQTLDEVWTLLVMPLQDDTTVKLFRLKENGVGVKVSEEKINAGEIFIYNGTEERCYKLIANKPVSAILCGGKTKEPAGWGRGATFYPDIDGNFIGKNFLITPISQYTDVYAVEDAEITVEDASGDAVDSWFSYKNTTKTIYNIPVAKPCYVKASGKIMVFSWWNDSATQIPSIDGGFIGKHFFVPQFGSPMLGEVCSGFIFIFAYEDSDVTAVSLKSNKIVCEASLKKGEHRYFYNLTRATKIGNMYFQEPLFISSTGLIGVFSSGSEGSFTLGALGDDVFFVPGMNGEYLFYVSGRGYIFAPDDVKVTINGEEKTLKRDHYVELKRGEYSVKSDKPVIIEVIEDPGSHVSGGAAPHNDWGNIIISYESIEPTEPLTEGGAMDYMTIVAVLAAAIIIVTVVIKKIRKPRKESVKP